MGVEGELVPSATYSTQRSSFPKFGQVSRSNRACRSYLTIMSVPFQPEMELHQVEDLVIDKQVKVS